MGRAGRNLVPGEAMEGKTLRTACEILSKSAGKSSPGSAGEQADW